MAELVRLEEERSKCRARLLTASTDKSRPRLLVELAGYEARLGRAEEALAELREAIACGLDPAYGAELRSSTHLASLRPLPAFEAILAILEGTAAAPQKEQFSYAPGEKERCLEERLVCGLCNEPLRDPCAHNLCGSLFCSTCRAPSCPQCQGAMTDTSVSKVFVRILLDRLDALKVHCPRCCKTLPRASLDKHLEECAVKCPSGCALKISPASLGEHARVCVAVKVPCVASDVSCPWMGARKELYNHKRNCFFVKQQDVLRRVIALEEANRVLVQDNCELKARVVRLEDAENVIQ